MYSLFGFAPIVCGGLVLEPCIFLQYFVSFSALEPSSLGRES